MAAARKHVKAGRNHVLVKVVRIHRLLLSRMYIDTYIIAKELDIDRKTAYRYMTVFESFFPVLRKYKRRASFGENKIGIGDKWYLYPDVKRKMLDIIFKEVVDGL